LAFQVDYLEIRSKNSDYAYATGRIRGLETYLLGEADFSRLREARRVGEALEILSKIFPYSESLRRVEREEDFEAGLEEELRRTYLNLKSFCPEPDLVDLFWIQYDFHNLKVLLKVHLQSKLPFEDLLSSAGTQNVEIFKEAILKEDFFNLPLNFKVLLERIFPLVKENPQPQFIDILLDKELFWWISRGFQKYNDHFLIGLLHRLIDSFNIKTFLRIKLWREREELYENIFIEGGEIPGSEYQKLFRQPVEALVERLHNINYKEAIKEALKEWEEKESLFTLDHFFEENILNWTRKGSYITFGREPLINYIFLKQREIKILRGILRRKLIQC